MIEIVTVCPEDGRLDSTGPTLKEYEQQLKKLSDENENLKLKIFFVEERLKTVHGIFDVEDLLKKNAELEVVERRGGGIEGKGLNEGNNVTVVRNE